VCLLSHTTRSGFRVEGSQRGFRVQNEDVLFKGGGSDLEGLPVQPCHAFQEQGLKVQKEGLEFKRRVEGSGG